MGLSGQILPHWIGESLFFSYRGLSTLQKETIEENLYTKKFVKIERVLE